MEGNILRTLMLLNGHSVILFIAGQLKAQPLATRTIFEIELHKHVKSTVIKGTFLTNKNLL